MEKKVLFEISNISKKYKSKNKEIIALSIEYCRFYRDETTAILGCSGAGKSTLFFLLSLLIQGEACTDSSKSFIKYNDGESKLNKEKVKYNLKNREKCMASNYEALLRQEKFGFIFQDSYLLPHLSSVENCAFPLALKEGYSMEKSLKRAEEMLKTIFKDRCDIFEKKPRDLSSGQRQRVAIARALIHNPDVIFGDELAGNLDPINAKHVLEKIKDLCNEKKINLLLITHNFQQAFNYCERFLLMHGGKLIGCAYKSGHNATKEANQRAVSSGEDLFKLYEDSIK